MQYIAIHHTAVKKTSSPQLWAVNRYHKDKWNMKSNLGWYVGYNYFIDIDGTLTQTRSWSEETIANKGHNCDVPERCDTISVCFAGNYNVEYETGERQEQTLYQLILDIKRQHPDIKVVGHRDLQEGRTCPGTNINEYDLMQWNKIGDDEVDSEKALLIAKQQKLIDQLKSLIQKLKALLNGRT